VKPLKHILDTARDLGASKFVSYIEESGLSTELTKEGTYTLFAPLDDAFDVSLLSYYAHIYTDLLARLVQQLITLFRK
jgi:uncharacterized surface protein with fasciclin (FAS1) repeats